MILPEDDAEEQLTAKDDNEDDYDYDYDDDDDCSVDDGNIVVYDEKDRLERAILDSARETGKLARRHSNTALSTIAMASEMQEEADAHMAHHLASASKLKIRPSSSSSARQEELDALLAHELESGGSASARQEEMDALLAHERESGGSGFTGPSMSRDRKQADDTSSRSSDWSRSGRSYPSEAGDLRSKDQRKNTKTVKQPIASPLPTPPPQSKRRWKASTSNRFEATQRAKVAAQEDKAAALAEALEEFAEELEDDESSASPASAAVAAAAAGGGYLNSMFDVGSKVEARDGAYDDESLSVLTDREELKYWLREKCAYLPGSEEATLVLANCDSLQQVLALDQSDFEQLGIRLGARALLAKRAREYQEGDNAASSQDSSSHQERLTTKFAESPRGGKCARVTNGESEPCLSSSSASVVARPSYDDDYDYDDDDDDYNVDCTRYYSSADDGNKVVYDEKDRLERAILDSARETGKLARRHSNTACSTIAMASEMQEEADAHMAHHLASASKLKIRPSSSSSARQEELDALLTHELESGGSGFTEPSMSRDRKQVDDTSSRSSDWSRSGRSYPSEAGDLPSKDQRKKTKTVKQPVASPLPTPPPQSRRRWEASTSNRFEEATQRAKVAAQEDKAAALAEASEGGAEERHCEQHEQRQRLVAQLPDFCDALHSFVVQRQQRDSRSKLSFLCFVTRARLLEKFSEHSHLVSLKPTEKLLDMCLEVAPLWCRQVTAWAKVSTAVKTSGGVDSTRAEDFSDGKSSSKRDATGTNKVAGTRATDNGQVSSEEKRRLVQVVRFDCAVEYASVQALANAHASKA